MEDSELRESRLLIEWWLRIEMALESEKHSKMREFLAFIDAAESELLKYKIVFIMKNKGESLEKTYSLAEIKYKQLSIEQKLRFDILFQTWKRNKQQFLANESKERERL